MATIGVELRKMCIKQFSDAIKDNNLQNVKRVINDNKIDPKFENCAGAQEAAWYGHIEILQYFLQFMTLGPQDYASLSCALRLACVKNHDSCVIAICDKIKNCFNVNKSDTTIHTWEVKHKYYMVVHSDLQFLKDKKLDSYIQYLLV